MPATPLCDCTNAAMQAENKDGANTGVAALKRAPTSVRKVRHNPYVSLLAPEDSCASPYSAFSSPVQWTSASTPYETYHSSGLCHPSAVSTPHLTYHTQPEEVSRNLFSPHSGGYLAQQEAASATDIVTKVSSNSTSLTDIQQQQQQQQSRSGSTGAAPLKSLGRIYVGGRPKPVRRRHSAEVTVALRTGEATFSLPDVYTVFPSEVAIDCLVGYYVIVEGDRGEDMGQIVAVLKTEVVDGEAAAAEEDAAEAGKKRTSALPAVLRLSTEYDLMLFDQLDQVEEEALLHCRACVEVAKLEVPITVERAVFQFDRQKLTVQYTSDAYVDFKALTRMLHNHHKCRIWMDQLNRESRAAGGGNREKNHQEQRAGDRRRSGRGSAAGNGRRRRN